MLTIEQIKSAVSDIAPKYSIRYVNLFGSYAEGHAKADSDVDVIIKANRPFSLFDLAGFQLDLVDRLHTNVDVVEEEGLENSKLIIDKVINLYEQ